MNEQAQQEQKRKPGRPRHLRNFIVYRSGRKLKAWNTDLCVDMIPNEREITGAVTIYKGLGEDWVCWGKKLTRDGDYNIAQGNPFRQVTAVPTPVQTEMLERDYREFPQVRKVMDAMKELFDGKIPFESIELHGARWMRTIGHVFIRDAVAEGISRNQYKRPEGKLAASVNVLESQGAGVNYTLETWRSVCHMFLPPVFCIRMSGEEIPADDIPEGWTPKDLANAILHSLWSTRGVNSCQADVSTPAKDFIEAMAPAFTAPEVPREPAFVPIENAFPSNVVAAYTKASDEATLTLLPTPEPTPLSGDPDSLPVQEDEKVEQVVDANKMIEPTVMTEAEKQLPAPIINEATPSNVTRTWGEIKQTLISLKGLTTSKELQAPAPLSRVLETVISHEATARLTAECRAIADKKARNEFKAENLHVFYPSAVFGGRAGGSKKENVIDFTGIAVLDFDGLKTQADAEDMRDTIFMSFPEVLFCAVSASGLGVYALVMLDFDGTESGYKASLSAAMEQFESHGFMPDAGCSDPTRARYMSSDPDALSRPDAYTPKAFAGGTEGAYILPASMLRGTWTNSGRKKKGAGKLYLEEALRRIETAPEGMKDTTLTSVMGSVARLIRNYSMDSTKVYDQVRKVASACSYDTRKTEDKIRRLGVKSEGVGL